MESIIEEKSKRYMDNNKEIKEFALGGVFDYIKESLNVTIKNATTGSPQNFAEKFSFDDKESVKIENGELVIKGKIDGVSTDFYYNLNKGGIYTTPNIGRIGDVYRIHNKHDNHNSENNSDHTRIALIPDFPSFDGVIKLTKKGISRNKVAFEEAKKLSPTERGSVIHKLFHSSLENNSLLSDVDQNREKFLKQVETDQFMESCFTTFQIKFEGNSVEKAKDKDAFHLLQVLEQST
ncbi:MAG: hypothetical protein LBD11_02025 [Candidatus Peribacteria bacterium]|nr:hypothetical protein [Candidatus Peribacteria bacterium]